MRVSTATLLASLASSALAAGTCSPLKNFKMTFYGFPDNSPPGPAVRYNCGGRAGKASGDGTYANPLTMATEHGRFAECEIVYSPYLQKYLRNEDSCANCSGDWVDVWLGSTTSDGGSPLLSCQNTLTQGNAANRAIITSPPADLAVSAAELFSGGACHSTLANAALDAVASCIGTGLGTIVPAVPVSGGSTGSGSGSTAPSIPSVVPSVPAVPSAVASARPRHMHSRIWRNKKGAAKDEDDEDDE